MNCLAASTFYIAPDDGYEKVEIWLTATGELLERVKGEIVMRRGGYEELFYMSPKELQFFGCEFLGNL